MPEWINARTRTPERYGQYFVKINGRPDIYNYHEFSGRLDRLTEDDKLFWLDESSTAKEVKQEVAAPKIVWLSTEAKEKPKPAIFESPEPKPDTIHLPDPIGSILKTGRFSRQNHLKYLEKVMGIKKSEEAYNKLCEIK